MMGADVELVSWYVWIGNPVIATGLMSFLLHEVRPAPFPRATPH